MKLDILYILENQTDFISTNQLQMLLGYSNMYLVKKNLRELKEDIQEFYENEEVLLVISHHNGIKLIHESDHLHPFIIDFLSKDIAIELLMLLLFTRDVSTENFCETYYISESSLRRKVKEINQHLAFYHLKITLSRKIRLVGPENKIRLVTFALLFFIYRTPEMMHEIPEYEDLQSLTHQLNDYLNVRDSAMQREILFFIILSYVLSIKRGAPYYPEPEHELYFDHIDVLDKPDFLSDWSFYDWKLFILSVHCADLHSTLLNNSQIVRLFQKNKLTRWQYLFTQNFRELTQTESSLVKDSLISQFLTRTFFIMDNELFEHFHIIDEKKMRQSFPLFFNRFELFWQQFVQEFPESDFQYLKTVNFLFCLHLMPVESMFFRVHLHIYDLPDVLKTYIRLQVFNRFGANFHLIFVDEAAKADLILGTVSSYDIKVSTTPLYLCIKMNLTTSDYDQIEISLWQIIEQKGLAKTSK
ncbi:hypothetical protein RV11_GL003303 [Enterococcus phoeniculicola]|jgi:hypothetical protein|nr:hypothetical protein RV11_GL003303 [Enterococcus phoeniculicola]